MQPKRTPTDHRNSITVRDDKGRFTSRSAPRKKKESANGPGPALDRAWKKHQEQQRGD